jgi:hypothetical protein
MDKKHQKKIKRAKKKKKEKAQAHEMQQRLTKQINMFDNLPDVCNTCKVDFPRTREAHMSWRVVVKTEKEKVWLFCPDCQQKAKELVEKQNEI